MIFIVLGIGIASIIHFNPFNLVSHWLGTFKLLVLIIVVAASLFVYRPWCTLLCPFGFLMNLTSKLSTLKLRLNENCVNCAVCAKKCPTDQANKDSKMAECYWCGRCLNVCKKDAIVMSVPSRVSKLLNKNSKH